MTLRKLSLCSLGYSPSNNDPLVCCALTMNTLTHRNTHHPATPYPYLSGTLPPKPPSPSMNTHPSACSTPTLYEHSPFSLHYPQALWTLTLQPAAPSPSMNTHPSSCCTLTHCEHLPFILQNLSLIYTHPLACSTLTLYQHSPFILQYPHPQELWTLTLQPAAPSPSMNTHPSSYCTLTHCEHSSFILQYLHPLSTLTLQPAGPSPSINTHPSFCSTLTLKNCEHSPFSL